MYGPPRQTWQFRVGCLDNRVPTLHLLGPLGREDTIVKTSSTKNVRRREMVPGLAAVALAVASLTSTGCQIDVSGQTLPSPYYLSDDVQFYAPGPEFKLANEAAALAEQNAAQISERQR